MLADPLLFSDAARDVREVSGSGDVVDDALSQPKQYRTVAGIGIAESIQFEDDHRFLKEELGRNGVCPIVVLPLTLWEGVCNAAMFYRLNPDGNCQVRISTRLLQCVRDEIESGLTAAKLACSWEMLFYFLFAGIGIIGYWSENILELGISIVGYFVCRSIFNVILPRRHRGVQEHALRLRVDEAVKNGQIYSLPWPSFSEPNDNDTRLIRISLPSSPLDVQRVLVATEYSRLLVQIAVPSSAIILLDNPADVLLGGQSREISAHLVHEGSLIAYVRKGIAVAVVAQYGDFPAELQSILRTSNDSSSD